MGQGFASSIQPQRREEVSSLKIDPWSECVVCFWRSVKFKPVTEIGIERKMAQSFPEHLQKTTEKEKKEHPETAMKEMKEGEYSPEIEDAIEFKRRRGDGYKEFCAGTCGKEYSPETLKKYGKGMCSKCYDRFLERTGGHYSEENAKKRKFYENADDLDSDDEDDSDFTSGGEESDEGDATESDEEKEEEPEVKPPKKKKAKKGSESE